MPFQLADFNAGLQIPESDHIVTTAGCQKVRTIKGQGMHFGGKTPDMKVVKAFQERVDVDASIFSRCNQVRAGG